MYYSDLKQHVMPKNENGIFAKNFNHPKNLKTSIRVKWGDCNFLQSPHLPPVYSTVVSM